ncbi:MAG: hypothetical protein LBQ24_00965 [Candidatus Peribacteria bacterium]|nr:hypothetical protein [Candidatus Peribacteria bacterium]
MFCVNVPLLQVYVVCLVCVHQSIGFAFSKFGVVSLCFVYDNLYQFSFIHSHVQEQSCLQVLVSISYVYQLIHLNAHCSGVSL